MNRWVIVGVAVLAVGCAATELTAAGEAVRIVEERGECEFVETVTESGNMGASPSVDAESAMNKARNRAAALGANAVRFINVYADQGVTTAVGEALRCESS